MLPILPILLIAKLSIALPASKGGMKEAELNQYVENIGLNHPAQFQLDSAAGLLVAFHTFLVLLQASTRKFEDQQETDPQTGVTHTFPGTMVVASFTGESLKWLEESKSKVKSAQVSGPVDPLANMLQQDYPDNLKLCLAKLDSLPDNFSALDCLANCLKSVSVQKPEILKTALKLGLDILSSADLQAAKSWTKEQNALTNTKNWLGQRLNLPSDLTAQINAVNDVKSKKILHQNQALLVESSKFYKEAISRLKDTVDGNDMAEAISKITEQSTNDQKKHWEDLQNALYGALSWHMYCQARYASNQVQYILKT